MNNQAKSKNSGLLFFSIAVLPPFIFMFHLYTKNAEYVNFWHVLILTLAFALGGALFYLLAARIGKSPQGAALVCVFLWVMFFTMHAIYQYSGLYTSTINKKYKIIILITFVLVLMIFVFCLGRRFRKIEIYKIIIAFEVVVCLFNVTQTVFLVVSKTAFRDSDSNYKTSFAIAPDSPNPNIYWLFMDGMLGFKAMEYFFDDPQTEFEAQLIEREFLVNREAEFEVSHSTRYAIPALMSPFFYDNVMFPLLLSIDLNDYDNKRRELLALSITLNKARQRNELIAAFNSKDYQTFIITTQAGYFFYPTTKGFYLPNGKIENRTPNNKDVVFTNQLFNLLDLMATSGPLAVIRSRVNVLLNKQWQKKLHITPIKKSDIQLIYEYPYINALAEIFESPEPRFTIIHDLIAHASFGLNEDGTRINRTGSEGLDIYNYPPQHRFARKRLVTLLDFILEYDPDSIIVIQADHGLHDEKTRELFLSSGGTPEEVRLMQNQTMSAVRIPEKWGGLDAPLDPLNITRLLVNRYVGQNYELLESHP